MNEILAAVRRRAVPKLTASRVISLFGATARARDEIKDFQLKSHHDVHPVVPSQATMSDSQKGRKYNK